MLQGQGNEEVGQMAMQPWTTAAEVEAGWKLAYEVQSVSVRTVVGEGGWWKECVERG